VYVRSDDLSVRIERGAIPFDDALPNAQQIAEALEAAHEQGIRPARPQAREYQGSQNSSRLVSRIFASWNQLDSWLRQIEGLRAAA